MKAEQGTPVPVHIFFLLPFVAVMLLGVADVQNDANEQLWQK